MPSKTITIATNYNGKLACDAFLHIDAAPEQAIPEPLMKNTDVTIVTKDGSHPPVQVRLVDICRLNMWELSSIVTYASHAMSRFDFIEWISITNPRLGIVSKMAIYIYQKI